MKLLSLSVFFGQTILTYRYSSYRLFWALRIILVDSLVKGSSILRNTLNHFIFLLTTIRHNSPIRNYNITRNPLSILSFLIKHLIEINSLYEIRCIILILKLLNYIWICLINLMNITNDILASFFINSSILWSFSDTLFRF